MPDPVPAAEDPTLLFATTDTAYLVPSFNPDTIAKDAAAGADTDILEPPPLAVTTNPDTGSPPSTAGGNHDTTNAPSRPNTDETNGAAGTCAGRGTTGLDEGDTPDEPLPFDAETTATSAAPVHNPPTRPAEFDPATESVNGPAHPGGGVTPPGAGDTDTV